MQTLVARTGMLNAKVNGARNVRPVERSGTMFDRLVSWVLDNLKVEDE
jgi:hypothetical protein